MLGFAVCQELDLDELVLTDISVMQKQCESMRASHFLSGLPSNFDIVYAQLLFLKELPSPPQFLLLGIVPPWFLLLGTHLFSRGPFKIIVALVIRPLVA